MPLLDSDVNDVTMATDMDDTFRTRSGSGGIRNFFRKKHKSGSSGLGGGGEDSRGSSRGSSPGTTPGSKVKTLLDAIRPRSKSDAASAMPITVSSSGGYRKRVQSGDPDSRQRSISVTGEHPNISSLPGRAYPNHSGSGSSPMTAMGQLLADGSPLASQDRPLNQAALLDKFRSRAYSDPKRASAAAIAARNAMMAKRVSRTGLRVI